MDSLTLSGEYLFYLAEAQEVFELTVINSKVFEWTLPPGSRAGVILEGLTRADLVALCDWIQRQLPLEDANLSGL